MAVGWLSGVEANFMVYYRVFSWGSWDLLIYLIFILTVKIWQEMGNEILPCILLSSLASKKPLICEFPSFFLTRGNSKRLNQSLIILILKISEHTAASRFRHQVQTSALTAMTLTAMTLMLPGSKSYWTALSQHNLKADGKSGFQKETSPQNVALL